MHRLEEKGRPLTPEQIEQALDRVAEAVLASVDDPASVVLVGIRTGGVPLAERLQARLKGSTGVEPPLGVLDITLYRDDLLRGLDQPEVGPTQIPFRLRDRWVVLVDDVLYTGRTVRAAVDALMDFGRPRRVFLAVLIDRGGRELPIAADAVGATVEVPASCSVEVRLAETHGEDAVVVVGTEED